MSSDTPVTASAAAKRIAPDDAQVPAPKIRTSMCAQKLVLVVLNEDACCQALEIEYSDMPADLAKLVRDRLHTRSDSTLYEGPDRDPIFRRLMIAIGAVEPSDPGENPVNDKYDWNDGNEYESLKSIYKTVPVHTHPGWFLTAPKGTEPYTFIQSDVAILHAFF